MPRPWRGCKLLASSGCSPSVRITGLTTSRWPRARPSRTATERLNLEPLMNAGRRLGTDRAAEAHPPHVGTRRLVWSVAPAGNSLGPTAVGGLVNGTCKTGQPGELLDDDAPQCCCSTETDWAGSPVGVAPGLR